MIDLEKKRRKSRALGTGLPECLANIGAASINVVHGCPTDCAYCKYQAGRRPEMGKVVLYQQLAEQLEEELMRERRKSNPVRIVQFNTASEPFCGDSRIEEVARRCLEVLLDYNLFINIATRGIIPQRTLDVLARKPRNVMISYTLTSMDAFFRKTFEPNCPTATAQLQAMRQIHEAGLPIRGRIDPLIPMENDSSEQVDALMSAFRQVRAREVVISYLQMGTMVANRLRSRLNRIHASMLLHWYRGADGTVGWLLDPEYRRNKYDAIKQRATKYGIRAMVCACRNADMFTGRCHIVPPHLLNSAKTLL